jgi:hypothetical protein
VTVGEITDDVTSVEYRHEVVTKTAKDLIDGRKYIQVPLGLGKKFAEIVGGYQGDLMGAAALYFSNKPLTVSRDELELGCF